MHFPKVTIIVLNWNGKEDTIECLESLKHITYPNYEILLVDNGSTDGSVEYFRDRYPEIKMIVNRENLGFAEGNNIGMRWAMDEGADYVLLLNNDTVVDPEFLIELVKVAESDSKIGIVGPKMFYYDYEGRKDVIWFAGGKINWKKGRMTHLHMNKTDDESINNLEKVDYITGAAILIKNIVMEKIGVLDSEYFAYFEETDLCVRASAMYYCVFVPRAEIWHKVSRSTGGDFSPTMAYYYIRNNMLFMAKNYQNSVLDWIRFIIYYSAYSVKKAVIYFKKGEMDVLKSICKGYIDGMKFFIKTRLCR